MPAHLWTATDYLAFVWGSGFWIGVAVGMLATLIALRVRKALRDRANDRFLTRIFGPRA